MIFSKFFHKNKFDFFISKHIISDIPYCFLGGFKTLDNETKKIDYKVSLFMEESDNYEFK